MNKGVKITYIAILSIILLFILLVVGFLIYYLVPDKYDPQDSRIFADNCELAQDYYPQYAEKAISIIKEYYPASVVTVNEGRIFGDAKDKQNFIWKSEVKLSEDINYVISFHTILGTYTQELMFEGVEISDFDKEKENCFTFLTQIDRLCCFAWYGDENVYETIYQKAFNKFLVSGNHGVEVFNYSKLDWIEYECVISSGYKTKVHFQFDGYLSDDYYLLLSDKS